MPLPYLQELAQQRKMTQVFRGINKNPKIEDGEFSDELNMSSRLFPCMAQRARRGTVCAVPSARALGGNNEGLAWISGNKLFYKSIDTGLTVAEGGDKQILSFGAYLIVFPDNIYYNTADPTDKGSMEATFASSGSITYTISRDDGTDYDSANIPAQFEPPQLPKSGDYWIDTSGPVHNLMQYSAYSDTWTQIPSVYTKIAATGIGAQFKEYDAVTISGATYSGANAVIQKQIEALNGSKIIFAAGTDYILVIGLLDEVYTQSAGAIMVQRKVPQMSHVVVAQNRMWGCYYGEVDGKTVNEIYASRLGDFTNFGSFVGISTDSYAVSVGQDGPFTGAVNFMGYPIFFKENVLFKVFGNQPRNYQVSDTVCAGVKAGSYRSIAIVNNSLFYLSRDGEVVSYDGSLPYPMFNVFAGAKYEGGVAGALGSRYYISAQRQGEDARQVLVYDTDKGMWHQEDSLIFIDTQAYNGELYALAGDWLLSLSGKVGTPETRFDWMATTGMIGWEYADQKYVSRFNFRVELSPFAKINLEIEYDSSGVWVFLGTYTAPETRVGTFLIPVIPRRCDHFRIRLSGKGEVTVYSMDRVIEIGGDGHAYI